jgi:hypothetical protein
MTIYMTPFDPATKQCTGPSVATAWASTADVVAVFGANHLSCSARTLVYADLAFTDYVLRVEP